MGRCSKQGSSRLWKEAGGFKEEERRGEMMELRVVAACLETQPVRSISIAAKPAPSSSQTVCEERTDFET